MINHRIIEEKQLERLGSDCMIYECLSLIEVTTTHYVVIQTTKTVGWCAKEWTTMKEYDNYEDAKNGFDNFIR